MLTTRWHPLLAEAFAALDAAGVRWSLLRPPREPEAPSGDVDLLADRRHRKTLSDVLEDCGFARVPNGGTPDSFFLRYDSARDCWLWLHITYEVSFGPLSSLPTDSATSCLARRRHVDGAWRLAAPDEFWVTLLHAYADKESVDEARRAQLLQLAQHVSTEGPVADAVAANGPSPDAAGELLEAVRSGRWDDARAQADALTTYWRGRSPARQARIRVAFFVRLVKNLPNPWRRRGLSVAILGPDGAGKSTLTAGLQNSFFFPTSTFYMDLKTHELTHVSALNVPGLTFLYYLSALWRRVASARWQQARGHLVLFDRYSYDVLTAADAPASRTKALARWLHTRLLPEAGLALVLNVAGGTMFARKGERTVVDLDAERERWLTLGNRIPNLRVIDAAQPIDRVRAEATALIWAEYARRWSSRRRRRQGNAIRSTC